MPTRAEEFQELRRLLGRTKPGTPDADSMVSELIAAEQWMTNRETNSAKAWSSPAPATVTTVANQAEYVITPSGPDSFGKALFVYRLLDDNNIIPVPHTDYSHELNNQQYEFWIMPPETNPTGAINGLQGEKVAFFRVGATVMMRIYPIPAEAGRVYTIRYATGWRDWSEFAWSDTPATPEYSRLRIVQAAMNLLERCEWEGRSDEWNRKQQERLAIQLNRQFNQLDPMFEDFIRNPQHEPVTELGGWWT